jgi:hypothetical protein
MSKDKCVLCGVETPYHIETHVDFRNHYVIGSGQLCKDCWNQTYSKNEISKIEIPTSLISNYSNDQELGQKIRELFFKKIEN